jgi:hypothetical protein
VARLAGDRLIAETTLTIPHPYPPGAAGRGSPPPRGGGARQRAPASPGRCEDGALLGAIGLGVEPEHGRAEIGYWIGVPYWGSGYATEATRA